MSVVFPDDGLCLPAVVADQAVESVGHVLIANVPGLRSPTDHGSVIGFRILQDDCILLRFEASFNVLFGLRW